MSAHFQPKTGTAALAGKRSGRKRSGEDERQGWLGSSGLQLSLGGGGAGLLKTQAANEVDEMKTRAEQDDIARSRMDQGSEFVKLQRAEKGRNYSTRTLQNVERSSRIPKYQR